MANTQNNYLTENILHICDNCHTISIGETCPNCNIKSIKITREKQDFLNCAKCDNLIVTTVKGDSYAICYDTNGSGICTGNICFCCWMDIDDIDDIDDK